jgi:hypothetical protein
MPCDKGLKKRPSGWARGVTANNNRRVTDLAVIHQPDRATPAAFIS